MDAGAEGGDVISGCSSNSLMQRAFSTLMITYADHSDRRIHIDRGPIWHAACALTMYLDAGGDLLRQQQQQRRLWQADQAGRRYQLRRAPDLSRALRAAARTWPNRRRPS